MGTAMTLTRCFLCSYFLVISCLASSSELKLLNWDEYIAPEVLQQFEKASGHKIKVIHYDSDAKRDEILASPAASHFDLAVIDNFSTQQFSKSGLLKNISKETLPSREHIGEQWRDNCGDYAVPYFWGTLGIAYHEGKVKTAPTSWADILKPQSAYQGHIGMILDSIDTLVPALKLLGHSMNTQKEEQLKSAYQLLKAQQPFVLTYDHPLTFLESDKADQLYMALVFGGDQYAMNNEEDGPWKYVIPKEGTALWVDCLAVLSSSKNTGAALEFLNFIHKPNIAKLNAVEVGSATTNQTAYMKLDEDIKNDATLYPSYQTLQNSEPYLNISPQSLVTRDRIIEALGTNETQ